MCVSALIVLGDKIRHKIDEQIQEQWLMSYIGEYGDSLCKLIGLLTGSRLGLGRASGVRSRTSGAIPE